MRLTRFWANTTIAIVIVLSVIDFFIFKLNPGLIYAIHNVLAIAIESTMALAALSLFFNEKEHNPAVEIMVLMGIWGAFIHIMRFVSLQCA